MFTGSHDKALKIWDISNMKNDSVFGRGDEEKQKEKEKAKDSDQYNGKTASLDGNRNGVENDTRIMIDDDDPYLSKQDTNGRMEHLIATNQYR